MKESKARGKWCPKSILVINSTGYGAGNRFGADSDSQYAQCLCLGSDCMMWEDWEYEKRGETVDDQAPLITMRKGEGDCGLKSKDLEVLQ